jgi:hypothetical protein
MATLRGPGTAASKRRPGTTGDIDEALTATDKGSGRHGARFTVRLAIFFEEREGFLGITNKAQGFTTACNVAL